jgi:hypothetical protein
MNILPRQLIVPVVPRSRWESFLWWASHPFLLPPIIVLVAAVFGSFGSEDIGHKQTIPLFLQGSTDLGGSNIFSATVALYVVCGILGTVQLTMYLDLLPPAVGFQVLNSGVDPVVAPRGFRHGLMLRWHALCDRTLGDLGPRPGEFDPRPEVRR